MDRLDEGYLLLHELLDMSNTAEAQWTDEEKVSLSGMVYVFPTVYLRGDKQPWMFNGANVEPLLLERSPPRDIEEGWHTLIDVPLPNNQGQPH